MAKKYTKRYYSKKRYSPNIKTINREIEGIEAGLFYATNDLCLNPVQQDNTVSQTYTVKNIEFTFNLDMPLEGNNEQANLENLICYIMYVPQGMNIGIDYAQQHPEYIMAMRFMGGPEWDGNTSAGNRNPLKVKTRLARRLQTGDKIVFYLTGTCEANGYACGASGALWN